MSKKKRIKDAVDLRHERQKAASRRHDLPLDEVMELEYEDRIRDLPDDDAPEPKITINLED